jgi:hypothetical protein|tara:strand:+ start:3700 stop:4338 length:639 start_codon:yes stop_codon:yes gene_type:complete
MKKTLLTERFQQLAGIKPLYTLDEQEESNFQNAMSTAGEEGKKYIAKAKELLVKANTGGKKMISQIQSSPQYQKIEAEIKKELATGKKSEAIVSTLLDILSKAAKIASSPLSTEKKRTQLQGLLKTITIIPGAMAIYGIVTGLLNFFPFVDIPTTDPGAAVGYLGIIVSLRIMLYFYQLFGSDKTTSEQVDNFDFVDDNEEQIILNLISGDE